MDEIHYTSCRCHLCSCHYEPMDVDLSGNSNNEMDISYNLSNDKINTPEKREVTPINADNIQEDPVSIIPTVNNVQPSSNIKKFHIKLNKETECGNLRKNMVLCAIVGLCISIIAYQIVNIQCSTGINTDELKMSLASKLYGQSRAIYSLVEALNVREENKILFFYGGTGVGKTFTASIILEQLGYNTNVYHYTMPTFMNTFTTDFMIGLILCKHTTVIVDDLNANDVDVIDHIKDLITKSQNLKKNVTVILIYNCDNNAKAFETQCDETFSNRLLQDYNDIDSFKMLIKFEPLKEEHLRKCIEKELGKRKLNDFEFKKVSKNFNVSLDGCKGVYTKVKVLDIL